MASTDPEVESRMRQQQAEYLDFLDDSAEHGVYHNKISEMIQDSRARLTVNINDLRKKYPGRAANLLQNGFEEYVCFQRALREIVAKVDSEYVKSEEEFFVAFEGSFGHRHVSPRTLKSNFLANMVCCEGIVTKCSIVRPKVVTSVHYCPNTKKSITRRYTDLTSFEAFPSSSIYPTEDENKNPLETEFGLSLYKDHQTFSIQEMPETAPAGQLPRSVDIVADSDLVDRCKPGDRIRVIGMFRCLPSKQQGFTAGTFRTILIANNIQLLSKEGGPNIQPADFELIGRFSKQKKVFEKLARSLAPSICGHLKVKEAILCLLLGGNEKVLHNGSRLRGDINVLLVGDPSVAKSQLLRYVLHTAPRAIATTGRGSSGVGLTAAVTNDPETGDRRLEAGAMVLADRGVVCIDEFDKMSDLDRTAIHEVMEQGRVTIAKAGIHAKLNARCAVLAAANPVYGRYDQSKNPMENIGMQDSLLSRFDLLFILLDKHIKEDDTAIANHVVEMHRYRTPGEEDGAILPMGAALETLTTEELDEDEEEKNGPTPIYEKNDDWIPGKAKNDRIISMMFMRKYIHMAKNCKPVLSEEAGAYIAQKYAELRESENKRRADHERVMPVTARTLETLIRISTAYAKARLASTVTEGDAESAYHLLHYACFREELRTPDEEDLKKAGRKRRRNASGDSEVTDDGDSQPAPKPKKKDKKDKAAGDIYEFDSDAEESAEPPALRPTKRRSLGATCTGEEEGMEETAAISVDRYATFRKLIRRIFDQANVEELPTDQVTAEATRVGFSDAEIRAAMERLGDDNAAMVTDGKMILI